MISLKPCSRCHVSYLRNDAYYKPDWVKCYTCGYMETKVKKCHGCESCVKPCGREEKSPEKDSQGYTLR